MEENLNMKYINIRKYLLILAVLMFAVSLSVSMCTKTKEKKQPNGATPIQTADERIVTISAVGDVTLAEDKSASSDVSFSSVLKNQNNDYAYFFRNVAQIFEQDNLTIANLECALSDRGSRADKTYAFRGKPEYTRILNDGFVDAVNLANNHSLDYGKDALTDTGKYLNDAGILSFLGESTVITEINGIKVGLCGANALNDTGKSQLIPAIQSLKTQGAQLIIASVHWGEEKSDSPLQNQIDLAHQAIDAGADLILGHHPHVLQGIEKYNGKYIVYSLGNFCFGGNTNPSDKDTMIYQQSFRFVNGELQPDDNTNIIPCRLSSSDSQNDYQPKIADGDQRESIIAKITERSAKVGQDAALNFGAGPIASSAPMTGADSSSTPTPKPTLEPTAEPTKVPEDFDPVNKLGY